MSDQRQEVERAAAAARNVMEGAHDVHPEAQDESSVQGGLNLPPEAAGDGRGQEAQAQAPGVQAQAQQHNVVGFDLNQFLTGIAAMQANQAEVQNMHREQLQQQQLRNVAFTDRDIVLAYMRLKPTKFDSTGDALDFLEEVERNARRLQANERQTIIMVEMSLKGPAKDWFQQHIQPTMDTMTWAEFANHFREYFLPYAVTESYRSQWLTLSRGNRSVQEYVTESTRVSRFAPDLTTDPARVNSRFVEGLGAEFVSLTSDIGRTLVQLIDSARQMEVSLIRFGRIPDPSNVAPVRSDVFRSVQSAPTQSYARSYSRPPSRQQRN